ncbi:MAG: hypothetical protein JSR85_03620 [Proteobacteria bacterium]|nr:hypothetical protein [Pseudomonadota bacterium]
MMRHASIFLLWLSILVFAEAVCAQTYCPSVDQIQWMLDKNNKWYVTPPQGWQSVPKKIDNKGNLPIVTTAFEDNAIELEPTRSRIYSLECVYSFESYDTYLSLFFNIPVTQGETCTFLSGKIGVICSASSK